MGAVGDVLEARRGTWFSSKAVVRNGAGAWSGLRERCAVTCTRLGALAARYGTSFVSTNIRYIDVAAISLS